MVREDIDSFIKTIPNNVILVAATKYASIDDMFILLKHGINNFGENRVDSFLNKYNELKNENIIWHFIGHLQRNKCKDIINKIDILHSLDSLELAKIIEKERHDILPTFIEVSINLEENKNGVDYRYLKDFIIKMKEFKKIKIIGLMMMSKKYSNHDELINQFKKIKELRNNLEQELNISLPYLSMGMSNDYVEAISQGANYIRLGRILFDL
ncbi:MAG: YggS family pyridoxal phosphate-dependent enzyme [Bacilli bacterium]